jgi:hypothetical protein
MPFNFIQVFFQLLFIWYLAYNLIKAEKNLQLNFQKSELKPGAQIEGEKVMLNEDKAEEKKAIIHRENTVNLKIENDKINHIQKNQTNTVKQKNKLVGRNH